MTLKRSFFIFLFLLLSLSFFAQQTQKVTLPYGVTEGEELWMDIYTTDSAAAFPRPCLVFVFGGGFKEGKRDADGYQAYFDYFANRGLAVVSIDYRLGMKGEKAPGA